MASRKWRTFFGVIVVVLFFVGIALGVVWWKYLQFQQFKKMFGSRVPVQAISTELVKAQDWQPYILSTGTLQANYNVNIVPQTSGIVTKIYFNSGEFVEANTPLVQLDDRQEQAQLKLDLAKSELNDITYERNKRLYRKGAISRQDLDTAQANADQARAAVEYDKVQISYKHIVAPFAGRLGIREISLGEYISTAPGSSVPTIVNIQQVDPLYIQFTVPQKDISKITLGQKVLVNVDAYGKRSFEGVIDALNAGVDTDSRMMMVRAHIPNPQHELYGGMFATVSVLEPPIHNVIAVTPTAVTYNISGDTIYVIGHKDGQLVAEQRFVQVGEQRGDLMQILKGLNVGDEVIINGQIKLYPGAPVQVVPDLPTPKPDPQAEDLS